jgi:hypothetical protein
LENLIVCLYLVDMMDLWEELCVVCGAPLRTPDPEGDLDTTLWEDDIDIEWNGLEWLNDCLGITASEERVPLDCDPIREHPFFETTDGTGRTFCCATTFRAADSPVQEGGLYGLTCHRKCCELLERDLRYTLRFHDVWPMLMRQKLRSSWLECTDYGGMAEYINEAFYFQWVFMERDGWMLEDPTTHRENGERILKVWRAIIQSGFQLVKAEPAQAQNETLAAPGLETSMVESRLQKIQLGYEPTDQEMAQCL